MLYDINEYAFEYKSEAEEGIVIQTSNRVILPKALAIQRYYEIWCGVNTKNWDIHIFENGKEITRKVNKFLRLEKR